MDKIKVSETDLHAQWEFTEREGCFECSNCHLIFEVGIGEDEVDERCTPYCPICGARMKIPSEIVDETIKE